MCCSSIADFGNLSRLDVFSVCVCVCVLRVYAIYACGISSIEKEHYYRDMLCLLTDPMKEEIIVEEIVGEIVSLDSRIVAKFVNIVGSDIRTVE